MSETNLRELIKPIAIGLSSGVAVLALVIGGVTWANSGSQQAKPTPSVTVSETPSETPSASATPTSTAQPCSVAKFAADKDLGSLQAMVVDANTGATLFNIKETKASATASTMKLLTSVVALEALGKNYRALTKVYQDASDPSVIYLVGYGDVTLSTTDAGKQSVYVDAPKLATLAKAVKAELGDTQVSKIVADSSYFAGNQWLKSWERSEQTQGYMSQVSALQVDGDRKKPWLETSYRSTTPENRAAKSFKSDLGDIAADARVELGATPSDATELASIKSQPISKWLPHMLKVSDNTQAEALARLSAIKLGFAGDFASIDQAYKKVFTDLGLDPAGQTFMDGSGLSDYNAVSPEFMIEVLKKIYAEEGDLALVKDNLAVAGESGTLSTRFTGSNSIARAKVFAKTGWINHGYTLAGYLKARDGSRQLFVVYALGKVDESAKEAIDSLVTGFFKCGAKLANG